MAQVTWSSFSFALAAFAAEPFEAGKLIPGGVRLNAIEFPYSDGQTITLAAGAVTAGANKTLNLTTPLTSDIPAGYVLNFGAGEFATLKAIAKKNDTTLTVDLAADVEGGETAQFMGVSGRKPIAAGALVGRTYAERDAAQPFGVADVATDDEIYLTAFGVEDATIKPDATLLRPQTLIYEDKIPGWATFSAAQKAAIRDRYQCRLSAEA
jgi:hypothetical protein